MRKQRDNMSEGIQELSFGFSAVPVEATLHFALLGAPSATRTMCPNDMQHLNHLWSLLRFLFEFADESVVSVYMYIARKPGCGLD
jgi:hypothetical protein